MLPLRPLPRNLGAALRDVLSAKVPVRLSAVRDLVRHAEGESRVSVIEALERALREDASSAVRAEAALALADGEARESVAQLVAAQDDVDRRVRQLALMAIGELARPDDAEAVEAVRAALRDDGPELRYQALIAAQRLLDEAAVEPLVAAMSDDDADVRQLAFRLAEERWLQDGSAALPAGIAESARRALTDEQFSVQLAAAILLGRTGEETGKPALLQAISSGGESLDAADEQAAIELAGTLGFEDARKPLSRRAFGGLMGSGGRFAWQCRVALAQLGDPRARETILRGLSAWTRDARTLAVVAAGLAGLQEARAAISAMQGDPRKAEPSAVAEALENLSRADPSAASAGAAGLVTGPEVG